MTNWQKQISMLVLTTGTLHVRSQALISINIEDASASVFSALNAFHLFSPSPPDYLSLMSQLEPLSPSPQPESKTSPLGSHSILPISIFLPPTILCVFTYFSASPTSLSAPGCLFCISFAFLSIWITEGTGCLLFLILCLKFYHFVLFVHSKYWAPTMGLASLTTHSINKTQSLKLKNL